MQKLAKNAIRFAMFLSPVNWRLGYVDMVYIVAKKLTNISNICQFIQKYVKIFHF